MQPGRVIDHPNPVVERVGDVDVAVAGGCHGARRVQLRRRRRSVVARIAVIIRAGDGDDLAGFAIDAAHPVVVGIGDDEVAVGGDGDAVRRIQLRGGGRTEIAREAGTQRIVADDGRDVAVGRVDAADDVIVRVGDEQLARWRDGDAARRVEPRLDGRTVVTGVAFARADDLRGGGLAQHEGAGDDRHAGR